MHIAYDNNTEFAGFLLNSTKLARNKFFKRITKFKNYKRIVHQLRLTPVVKLVRLEEEINAYISSKNKKTKTGAKMSHTSNKDKLSTLSGKVSNSLKESKSITNKNYLDLFGENESLKIHPNKLIKRSPSKNSTKENIVIERKSSVNDDKNKINNKEKYHNNRKECKESTTNCSSLSKTQSHKTENKCDNRQKHSSNSKISSTDKKCLRPKVSTSKDDTKKNTNTQKEISLSKLNIKNSSVSSHSKISSNKDKSITNKSFDKQKKITERKKHYHEKAPCNEKHKSVFKRSNSNTPLKTANLESDKKLEILQTNKQMGFTNSPPRKRLSLTVTGNDVHSDKENSAKHCPEKMLKLTDTRKENNTKIEAIRKIDSKENKKRSNSEVSLLNSELDSSNESKRPKINEDISNPLFSAFSTLDDTEVIAVDKTKILPPINNSNSPYVSFGDFLKNQNLPSIESSPKGPEFSCTPLEGDKLLIKKRSVEKKTIIIDITNDSEEQSKTEGSESSSINNLEIALNTSDKEEEEINRPSETSSKVSYRRDSDGKKSSVKTKRESLDNQNKNSPNINKGKTKTESLDIQYKKSANLDKGKSKIGSLDNQIKFSSNVNKGKSKKESLTNQIQHSSKIDNEEIDMTPKNYSNLYLLKNCDKVETLNNSNKTCSDSNNNGGKQDYTETSSKKECNDNQISVAKCVQNSSKIDCDSKIIKTAEDMISDGSSSAINNNRNKDLSKDDSTSLTENKENEIKEKLKLNIKSDKNVLHKLKILITEQAIEFITSDLVSVLNVYVDFKQYTIKNFDNKELNNKDIFIKNRLKYLKSFCKKLQSVKVYSFKLALFFESLIESIKIHIISKEALNEKTIIRFIHNVLVLLMENCTSPEDHYILYNHVVSAKSLQYLDQKSCFLKDTIDRQIIDCMNSFSIKLERPKDSLNTHCKESTQQIYCIDDSPNRITDITPGNSLPCINTGEHSITKISPKSPDIDKISQISIVDADNVQENLLDILENKGTTSNLKKACVTDNNQTMTSEKTNASESIESKLKSLFHEEFTDNGTNQTKIKNSRNSNEFECMDLLKNINPNKSYLAPLPDVQNLNMSIMSSVPVSCNQSHSITSAANKKTKDPSQNITVTILKDVIVTPAMKPNLIQPQVKPIENVMTVQETPYPSNQSRELKTAIPKKQHLLCYKSNTTTENQLPKDNYYIENTTTLPTKPYLTAVAVENKTCIPAKLNSVISNVSTNSSPSYTTNQIYQSYMGPPESTIDQAPIQSTNASFAQRQYCAPAQQTILTAQHLNQIAPAPSSQLQEASITTGTLLPKNSSNEQQHRKALVQSFATPQLPAAPPSPVRNHQPYLSNVSTSESLAQRNEHQRRTHIQPYTPSHLTTPAPPPVTSHQQCFSNYSTSESQLKKNQSLHHPQMLLLPKSSLIEQQRRAHIQPYASSQLPAPAPPPVTSHQQCLSNQSLHHSQILLQKSSSIEQQQRKGQIQSFTASQLPVAPPPPPPPAAAAVISHQPHLPNLSTSETISRSTYSSPMNLQSSISQRQITHQVTVKQVVHQMDPQAVQPQLISNATPVYQLAHENQVYLLQRQQAEQERHNELQRQKMLKQKNEEQMLRLQLQQQMIQARRNEEQQRQHSKTMRENMYFQHNNQNIGIMHMHNPNIPLRKPNEYAYQIGYPVICCNTMPHNSGIQYANSQQSRNFIQAPIASSSTQYYNGNLNVPPITTYQQPRVYATSGQYVMQSTTASNQNNEPMPKSNEIYSSRSVTAPKILSTLLQKKPHQRVSTAVANPSQNNTIQLKQNETSKTTASNGSNNSFEHHLTELEKILTLTPKNSGTKRTSDSNVSVRNSSRDSGYMTPPIQKDQICAYCLGVGSFICSGCVSVYYCSENCQTKAWPSHQDVCCFIEE